MEEGDEALMLRWKEGIATILDRNTLADLERRHRALVEGILSDPKGYLDGTSAVACRSPFSDYDTSSFAAVFCSMRDAGRPRRTGPHRARIR